MRLSCGEYEYRVGRRLFQRFQQRVERLLGEHMHFVYDIDLVARVAGREPDLVAQVADVVDAAIAGGVNLNEVKSAPVVDGNADAAFVVRLALGGRKAIHRLGEDARRAGFARAARAAKQVCVRDALLRHRLLERLDDCLLPNNLAQALGTPLAIENFTHFIRPVRRSWRKVALV